MKWLTLAVVLIMGCGEGDGGDDTGTGGGRPMPPGGSGTGGAMGSDPAVIGNWVVALNAICSAGANFDGTRYSLNTVCVDGTTVELDSTQGTYTTVRDEIHFSAEKATCSEAVKSSYLNYEATPALLTLSGSDGVALFMRNTASGGSGVATYGCFRGGAFTASPLVPL